LWYFPGASWTIRAPVTSYDYKTEWKKEFKQYSSCENQWNEEYGSEEVLSPEFAGIKGELVYFYPEGLYIEYEIAKAYYFARSGYILVFTQQPALASGDDTMHGFLLFREDVAFSKLSDSEWASGALRVFFSLLHAGRYGEASRYCGKGCYTWLRESNPAVAANDFPALLMYGCKSNGLQCLEINRIVRVQEISPTTFKITVEFKDDEGKIFAIKAEAQPPSSHSFTISEFSYTVKKVDDRFLVEGLPPYLQ
jgi:hypothetical protein